MNNSEKMSKPVEEVPQVDLGADNPVTLLRGYNCLYSSKALDCPKANTGGRSSPPKEESMHIEHNSIQHGEEDSAPLTDEARPTISDQEPMNDEENISKNDQIYESFECNAPAFLHSIDTDDGPQFIRRKMLVIPGVGIKMLPLKEIEKIAESGCTANCVGAAVASLSTTERSSQTQAEAEADAIRTPRRSPRTVMEPRQNAIESRQTAIQARRNAIELRRSPIITRGTAKRYHLRPRFPASGIGPKKS